MFNFIKNLFKKKKKIIGTNGKFGTGALPDPEDYRDYPYDILAMGSSPVDWKKGYDVEKELGIEITFKNQMGSSSCVGQGFAFYGAVLDAVETGKYDENSAKAIYSQIYLASGGAYLRDAADLLVDWGSLKESIISSYGLDGSVTETFMRNKDWKDEDADSLAKVLQAKEYRVIQAADNMDLFAMAIRDNYGVAGGVQGNNNGTWRTFEPEPPTGNPEWAHCIYFGKFGTDEKGRYIATPNSWGSIGTDTLHPDGWQKLREDYFNTKYMFNPWTLVDKPNNEMSEETKKIMANNEKKVIIEGEGAGRKGVIVNGELREIVDEKSSRAASACLYVLTNNGFGQTVSTETFNNMKKGLDF